MTPVSPVMMRVRVSLLGVAALGSAIQAQQLDLKVGTDGQFAITHDGKPYLSGIEYQVAGLSRMEGSLLLVGSPVAGSGTDALGSFKSTTLGWAANGTSEILIQTSFRTYPEDPGMIVFEQRFPKTLGRDASVLSQRAESRHTCRLVTRPHTLTPSSAGYSAYTLADGDKYNQHVGKQCDAERQWALTADLDRDACEAKCRELSCSCYDHTEQPTPLASASAPASRTVFPGFARSPGPGDKLDCFAYHDTFPRMKGCTVATYSESRRRGSNPRVLQ